MDLSGDESVALPANAISAAEMLDEPGTASATLTSSVVLSTGSYTNILNRTITTPAPGYVLVIATAQGICHHTTGANSDADFGVSDVITGLPTNQDVRWRVPGVAASGQYDIPLTVHGLFEVASAGAHTFYFLGYESTSDFTAYDAQLSLVYLPSAYGLVSGTMVAGSATPDEQAASRPGFTAAEVSAERAESQAANQARIDRELAAMRERLQRLEAELAAERAGR
jgi:hypothetical protein